MTDNDPRTVLDDQAQLQRAELLHELADPVAVFAKLGREVRAAEVLVSLSTTGAETRAAALAGLHSVRVALDDARHDVDVATEHRVRTQATLTEAGA